MSNGQKTLVLYVFHILNDRVRYFINKAVFKDDSVDFLFISNNKQISMDGLLPSYVQVIYRDNIGYDFGGWSDALLTNNRYAQYDHFIFVNSSVIGPFLPSYYKGKWTDIYLQGLTGNVKLFGSTINTCMCPVTKSHVQSYIFAMDKATLEYLIQCEIFSLTKHADTFIDAINNKEILMSRKVIDAGWNIASLLPHYANIDFTFKEKRYNSYGVEPLDDVMFPRYRGIYWNEHQLVFIKGNRFS